MADKDIEMLNDRDIGVGEDVIGVEAQTLSTPPSAKCCSGLCDWKDVDFLRNFIPERGKIMPRRISGVSAKDQRRIAQAIKRARSMALIPFVAD